MPEDVAEVRDIIRTVVFTPLSDKRAFGDLREWLRDQFTLECDYNPERWADDIEACIYAGKDLKTMEKKFVRGLKVLDKITLEDIETLRAQTLTPERFAAVTVKPT
jgi:hypothetical protein